MPESAGAPQDLGGAISSCRPLTVELPYRPRRNGGRRAEGRATRRGSATGSSPRMATTCAGWRSAFVLMAMSAAIYGEELTLRPIGDAASRPEVAPAVPSTKTPEAAEAKADSLAVPKDAPSR